jgi:hypothetical protein
MKPSLTDRFHPPKTKICTACKIEKPIKDFSRVARSADGFDWACRACKKEHEDARKQKRKEYSKTFFDEKEF